MKKLKEILVIKAVQRKQDLPTTFKEVISVNCGVYCNTNGGVVDMSPQFLQSLLVSPSVKESTAFAWTRAKSARS